MSIESVMSRIAELTVTAPVQPAQTAAASAPAASSAASFAATLAQATAPSATSLQTSVLTDTDSSDSDDSSSDDISLPSLPQIAWPTTAPPATALPAATAPAATSGGASAPFDAAITAAASQNGVDPNLVRAVIQQESGFNPNAASGAGAQGLMQLMPGTAAGLGVTNSFDPTQSIEGGTRYLKQQLDHFGGNVSLALAAYNAGPNAVTQSGGIPPYPETQQYVKSVLANYQAFSSQSPTAERSSL